MPWRLSGAAAGPSIHCRITDPPSTTCSTFWRHPALQTELSDLAADKLKERGRAFREVFLSRLGLLLRGTVAAPPEKFGETLADEHIQGGAPLAIKLRFRAGTACLARPVTCACRRTR